MLIKKLRLQKGWSQEQLADISGLSTRTIQRLERGENASLETLKSLASVFEINVAELSGHYLLDKIEEPIMQPDTKLTYDEAKAIEKVKEIKGLYIHLIIFCLVISGLWILNLMTSPNVIWAWWPTFGWGIGVAGHAIGVLDLPFLFGAEWEKKQIEKRLGRKL
ncbi:helix-turn-helix domain-containing protein [Kangiella sp. HZ709]|uniref:helix-turn-helix domain-containing protein n=1 Tax=Kangiella sp. HZ709 TaxID=2666328 RepID=UPI0012AF8DEC|nr:helix-turn-helix domain-containing protein [Kangiella sp. HZ709]MRX28272.1 helix-turn-helix domain-containing protein [Kangiella sp. HZ709]